MALSSNRYMLNCIGLLPVKFAYNYGWQYHQIYLCSIVGHEVMILLSSGIFLPRRVHLRYDIAASVTLLSVLNPYPREHTPKPSASVPYGVGLGWDNRSLVTLVIKETHLCHILVKDLEFVKNNKIRLLLRCCKNYLLLLLHPCVGNFTAV